MAAVPWLDAHEQDVWRSFLDATRMLFDQLDRELQHDSGLSHADYEILVRLSEAPDRRMRMSDLADRVQFSRSRLSHTVRRLEGAGWVSRESCPTDRRGAFAVLTDEGLAVLEEAAPAHVRGVRRHLFDQLTPAQRDALGAVGRAVVDHLATTRAHSEGEDD